MQLQPFDLKPLLEKELELLQPEIEDHNIAVTLRTSATSLPVMGDQDRITQVVMNLLLNSIQAMPDGGKLQLAAHQGGDEEKGNTMVELTITDTGVGMKAEVVEQVFYPYFTTKKNGTGIGLALSQKIIVDHGGHIGIESEPNKGTVVTVQLPAEIKTNHRLLEEWSSLFLPLLSHSFAQPHKCFFDLIRIGI
ncbi:MAG: hypothetical protein CSA31_02800 [Desulfobulbus propionicus]|nr:MAG: hypothetical protein CSA31_02800 [Desulfobulbus propionicus]